MSNWPLATPPPPPKTFQVAERGFALGRSADDLAKELRVAQSSVAQLQLQLNNTEAQAEELVVRIEGAFCAGAQV